MARPAVLLARLSALTTGWLRSGGGRTGRVLSPGRPGRAHQHTGPTPAKTTPTTPTTPSPRAEDQLTAFRAQARRKNQTTLNYTISVLLGTVALSYGAVPFYKMICQKTGWGGQPVRVAGDGSGDDDDPDRLRPATDLPRIRVTFRASVSDALPWTFVPQQREVWVHPGETALAFYTATNTAPPGEDIIGVATYSVTPGQAAPYFSKIQCFCFEEQRLCAGETVDMPVFFYIDKAIATDRNCRKVEQITLNYTFFKAKYDREGHLRPVPMPSFGSSFGIGSGSGSSRASSDEAYVAGTDPEAEAEAAKAAAAAGAESTREPAKPPATTE